MSKEEYVEMNLRDIQLESLKVLKKIDNICNALNIKYFLLYGSLLGAVRHEGFIPWDDDLDIGMLEKDYNTLINFFIENKGCYDELELKNIETDDSCYYAISRICEKNNVVIFNDLNHTSGCFVDVYPIFPMGNEKDLDYWNKRNKMFRYYQKAVFMSSSKSIFFGNSKLHKILNIPFLLISKIIGKKYFINKMKNFRKFSIDESIYNGCPVADTFIYHIIENESLKKTKFEDFYTCIPDNYDQLLTDIYGDYMQLPPEEKQKPHHDYVAYKAEK